MRSLLFLFTLIASCFLVVSPAPVPEPKTLLPPKPTLHIQLIGPDGQNLGDDILDFPAKPAVTTKVKETLELRGEYRITYSGRYKLETLQGSQMIEEWVFLKVTEGGRTWFGWMAISKGHAPLLVQPLDPKQYVPKKDQWFMGLTQGNPLAVTLPGSRLELQSFKGRPFSTSATLLPKQAAAIKQWERLLVEFERHFRHPADQPLPDPLSIGFTVYFTNVAGEDLGNEDSNIDFGDEKEVTRVVHNLFGSDVAPHYKGHHERKHLPNSRVNQDLLREWVFIRVVNHRNGDSFYGYITQGRKVSGVGINQNTKPITYAAVSKGQPRPGRFAIYKSQPGEKQSYSELGKLKKQVASYEILGEYETYFMAPYPPLPVTAKFHDIPSHADHPVAHIDPAELTAQIYKALGLSPGGPIEYETRVPLTQALIFEATGGNPYCQPDDKCYGNALSQPDGKDRRILIVQPKHRGSTYSVMPKDFDIVGTYPPYDPMKGLVDATLIRMAEHWKTNGH